MFQNVLMNLKISKNKQIFLLFSMSFGILCYLNLFLNLCDFPISYTCLHVISYKCKYEISEISILIHKPMFF
jgi:hypothetical protein